MASTAECLQMHSTPTRLDTRFLIMVPGPAPGPAPSAFITTILAPPFRSDHGSKHNTWLQGQSHADVSISAGTAFDKLPVTSWGPG